MKRQAGEFVREVIERFRRSTSPQRGSTMTTTKSTTRRSYRKATGKRGSVARYTKTKTTAGRSGSRRYGVAASESVETAMRKRNQGTLMSGKGGKAGRVTSRKQAIAIGLSEARKKGAKVPARSKRSRKTR